MTGDITQSDAWERGRAAAKEQTAAAVQDQPTPVSYTSAALSILASPHIADWPADARQWLLDAADIAHLRDLTSSFCIVDGCGLTTDDDLCWRHKPTTSNNGGGML